MLTSNIESSVICNTPSKKYPIIFHPDIDGLINLCNKREQLSYRKLRKLIKQNEAWLKQIEHEFPESNFDPFSTFQPEIELMNILIQAQEEELKLVEKTPEMQLVRKQIRETAKALHSFWDLRQVKLSLPDLKHELKNRHRDFRLIAVAFTAGSFIASLGALIISGEDKKIVSALSNASRDLVKNYPNTSMVLKFSIIAAISIIGVLLFIKSGKSNAAVIDAQAVNNLSNNQNNATPILNSTSNPVQGWDYSTAVTAVVNSGDDLESPSIQAVEVDVSTSEPKQQR